MILLKEMEDDDDKPIMSLIQAKSNVPIKKEDEDDDNKPISALIAEKNNSPIKTVKQESKSSTSGNVSDSDDDIPIVEFIKKREREKQAHKASLEKKSKLENGKKITNSSSDRKSSGESKKSSSTTLEGNSSGSSNWNSDSLECVFYTQTDKGKLLQSFLRRWWYSYEWPVLSKLGDVPKGYEPLDGFPGVYVSTRADTLGKILDKRDKNTCPCLKTFVKKPSSEIKELCVLAIEKQMQELIKHEGEDNKLVIELRKELNEIKKMDTEIADKSGLKYVNSFDG